MDFTLDKKHEMARGLFRDFAETEVKPLAQETDETEQFPAETVAKMGKYGFMGIPVPKEYGGQGCDPLTYVMCVEELSKVCATTGVIVSAHTSLCIDPIMTFGTEEQKKKYVVPLAKGEKLGAFGLTEPGAGTDAKVTACSSAIPTSKNLSGKRLAKASSPVPFAIAAVIAVIFLSFSANSSKVWLKHSVKLIVSKCSTFPSEIKNGPIP